MHHISGPAALIFALVIGLGWAALHAIPAAAENERDTVRRGPFYFYAGSPETIYLRGLIATPADRQFRRILEAAGEPRRLILESNGGVVQSALEIAREIHDRGMDTLVPAGADCYSSCVFLFLAGATREVRGDLGVHQIVSSRTDFNTGQVVLAAIMEAMADFGVHDEVMLRMLRTPHPDVHVFSRADLRRLGINRESAPPPEPAAEVVAAATPPPAAIAVRAMDFLSRMVELRALPGDRGLRELERHYALGMQYHGQPATRHEVMAKKRAIAERWPERRYRLAQNSTFATCDPTRCEVAGEFSWVMTGRDGTETRGRSRLELVVLPAGEGREFVIVEETIRVLARE